LDIVFRESWLASLLPVVVGGVLVGIGVAVIVAGGAPVFGWFFTCFAFLLWLLFLTSFLNAFRSENWLMRYSPPRLFIKFRSLRNHRLPDSDPVVLELDTSEIGWIRKVKEKVITRGRRGARTELRQYLEIGLKRNDQLPELKGRIIEEQQRHHKGMRWLHYPVQVLDDVIRIEWRGGGSWITPNVDAVIDMLRSVVQVRQEQSNVHDYISRPADKARQEEMILELIERGQLMEAIELTRECHRCSLSEAKDFVEGLAGRADQGDASKKKT